MLDSLCDDFENFLKMFSESWTKGVKDNTWYLPDLTTQYAFYTVGITQEELCLLYTVSDVYGIFRKNMYIHRWNDTATRTQLIHAFEQHEQFNKLLTTNRGS